MSALCSSVKINLATVAADEFKAKTNINTVIIKYLTIPSPPSL